MTDHPSSTPPSAAPETSEIEYRIAIRDVGDYAITSTIGGAFVLVDESEEGSPVARFVNATAAREFSRFLRALAVAHPSGTPAADTRLRCIACGRNKDEVERFVGIGNPPVFVCDACIRSAASLLQGTPAPAETPEPFVWAILNNRGGMVGFRDSEVHANDDAHTRGNLYSMNGPYSVIPLYRNSVPPTGIAADPDATAPIASQLAQVLARSYDHGYASDGTFTATFGSTGEARLVTDLVSRMINDTTLAASPSIAATPKLTVEWCVETFHRVNPGYSMSRIGPIPSLYLFDFARAVLAIAATPDAPSDPTPAPLSDTAGRLLKIAEEIDLNEPFPGWRSDRDFLRALAITHAPNTPTPDTQ